MQLNTLREFESRCITHPTLTVLYYLTTMIHDWYQHEATLIVADKVLETKLTRSNWWHVTHLIQAAQTLSDCTMLSMPIKSCWSANSFCQFCCNHTHTKDTVDVDRQHNELMSLYTKSLQTKTIIWRRMSEWVDSQWHISTIRLYSAIHVGSRWKTQDRRQIKNTDIILKLNTTQK